MNVKYASSPAEIIAGLGSQTVTETGLKAIAAILQIHSVEVLSTARIK